MPLPNELKTLMVRYCQLGQLLPAVDDFDLDDAAAVAEARIVLREMEQNLTAIKSLLKKPNR